MVTMKDIAMLAGVSQQAVSAALNGNGSSRVSPAKREKIRKIARELNYVPNTVARVLAGGKTRAIGIVSAIDSGWNSFLLAEICMQLTALGYNTLISHYGNSNYCATDSLTELISRGVDGVIILNSPGNTRLANGLAVPFVFGSHRNQGGYDVGINNELTGYLGAGHLLEHGHAKAAFMRIMADGSADRQTGWRRAHAERGVEVTDQDIITLREIDGRVEPLLAYLRRRKVTALFCSNDFVAAKAMRCLLENGIRVPEDIALVGCDGHSFAEFCPVALTTVLQPLRPHVRKMVELLMQRIENRELRPKLARIKINPQLWLGGSCGCRSGKLEELYRINTPGALELDKRLNCGIDIVDHDLP